MNEHDEPLTEDEVARLTTAVVLLRVGSHLKANAPVRDAMLRGADKLNALLARDAARKGGSPCAG